MNDKHERQYHVVEGGGGFKKEKERKKTHDKSGEKGLPS